MRALNKLFNISCLFIQIEVVISLIVIRLYHTSAYLVLHQITSVSNPILYHCVVKYYSYIVLLLSVTQQYQYISHHTFLNYRRVTRSTTNGLNIKFKVHSKYTKNDSSSLKFHFFFFLSGLRILETI